MKMKTKTMPSFVQRLLVASVLAIPLVAIPLAAGCGGGGQSDGGSNVGAGPASGSGGSAGSSGQAGAPGGQGGASVGGEREGSAGASATGGSGTGGSEGSQTGGSGGGQLADASSPESEFADSRDATISSDGGSSSGVDADAHSGIPATGLGPWTGNDNVPPSANPPGGLKPEQVPMFVAMGSDDNPQIDGVNWVVGLFNGLKNPPGSDQAATYDGTTTKATFYHASIYSSAASSWKAAYQAGFETGDHTVAHADGSNFSEAKWLSEMQGCIDFLTTSAVGVKRADLWGFRTPFLRYNENTFFAARSLDFWYDCSIEEGQQPDQDGTNFLWPYTLDNGSPANAIDPRRPHIQNWPKGLWEMPAYQVITPPDEEAQKYGIPPGLRAKLLRIHADRVGVREGKITGLDYNLWYDFLLTAPEFLATLKYSLDQRRKGNRAPVLFGMHSAIYTNQAEPLSVSLNDRQKAIADFLKYALTYPEVRIVTSKAVLDWIRNPVALK